MRRAVPIVDNRRGRPTWRRTPWDRPVIGVDKSQPAQKQGSQKIGNGFRAAAREGVMGRRVMAAWIGIAPQRTLALNSRVYFLRQHKFVLSFLLLLVFCSIMVIRQLDARKSRHIELREAMILLQTGGYTNESDRLYLRLLTDLDRLSNRELIEDWQRTVILVDPGTHQPSNAVWRYYWTVRKEMERRGEDTIQRARKLAEE
jgi:hypothetical protein